MDQITLIKPSEILMKNEDLTWGDVDNLTEELKNKIKNSGKKYDWIVGIARGGLVPSVILSHKLNIPHAVFTAQSYDGTESKEVKIDWHISMIGFFKHYHNILVVDEINDSGNSLRKIVESLKRKDSDIINIDTAVLVGRETSSFKTSYCSKIIPAGVWINFPWENAA